jgi:competence protein ComEC
MGRFGEAIYITFPNGKNMLVDAAATETRDLLISTLKQMNVTKLDYVVATHYHSDHIGGLYKILDEFEVGTLYKPGFNIPSGAQDYYTELKARIDDPNKTFIAAELWRGDVFNIGDVNIEVLNPVNSDSVKAIMNGVPSTEDTNNNSIVMKMTYGENTALLLGDLYTEGEMNLLDAYRGTDKLRAELIKVAHHGDTTSSDPEFVAAVAPEIAVLTHFSDTIIVNNRYKAVGADTYVTGVDGITKVIFDGTQAEVITQYYVQE